MSNQQNDVKKKIEDGKLQQDILSNQIAELHNEQIRLSGSGGNSGKVNAELMRNKFSIQQATSALERITAELEILSEATQIGLKRRMREVKKGIEELRVKIVKEYPLIKK